MNYQFIPYSIPLTISTLFTLSLALYGLSHRSVPGAKAFIAGMGIGTLWTVANGLEMMGLTLQTKLFWANLQYLAYGFAPVAWLAMVMEFGGVFRRRRMQLLLLASIIPLITFSLVWFDPQLGLVRYGFSLKSGPFFPVIEKHYGPWFWIHFAQAYSFNVLSIILLTRKLMRQDNLYRRQATYLLAGLALIMLVNISYIVGISPVRAFDLSPFSFSISGLIIGWGIFKNRLFDVIPVARNRIVERMPQAIVVHDKDGYVLDVNEQAESVLNMNRDRILGQALSSIVRYSRLGAVVEQLLPVRSQTVGREVEVYIDGQIRVFDLHYTPVLDNGHDRQVWVLSLNDVTQIRRSREEIQRQRNELTVLEERERMARDLHDNLGQSLSFGTIQTQSILRELERGNRERATHQAQRLLEIMDSAHENLRSFVHNISQEEGHDRSFSELLRSMIRKLPLGEAPRVLIKFPTEMERLFDSQISKYQLLSMTGEAINNSFKHAGATFITVGMRELEKAYEYYIQDNGRGFDPAASLLDDGVGLTSMQERARLTGGVMKISASDDENTGTRVSILFYKNGEIE